MARFVGATLGLKKTVKKNHNFSYQVKEPLGETTGNRITGDYIACAWLYNAAKPGGTQLRATTPYKVIQRLMRGWEPNRAGMSRRSSIGGPAPASRVSANQPSAHGWRLANQG